MEPQPRGQAVSDESVFKKIAGDFMKDPGLKPMKTLSPFRGLKAPASSV